MAASSGSMFGQHGVVTVASLLAAVGGLLFGYDLGVISGAQDLMAHEFALSDMQLSVVVSSMLAAAVLGALLGGHMVDVIGRKSSIMAVSAVFVASGLLLGLASDFPTLVAGRILMGVAVSVSAIADCVYISEISPASVRGSLVSLNEVAITAGILFAYLANYLLQSAESGWRLMFVLPVVPALLQGVAVYFMPKGRHEDALRVLRRLRENAQETDVRKELADMLEGVHEEREMSLWHLCQRGKGLWWRLVVGLTLVFFQSITGQPCVLLFTPRLMAAAGFEQGGSAVLASVILGAVKFVCTAYSIVSMDRHGRQRMLLIGGATMGVSATTLGLSLLPAVPEHMRRWGVLASALVFTVGFALGYGPVAWVYLAEIWPAGIRGRAMAVTSAASWGFSSLVTAAFLPMLDVFGLGPLFLFFGSTNAMSLVFIRYCVVETRGRSLEEISSTFKDPPSFGFCGWGKTAKGRNYTQIPMQEVGVDDGQ